MRKPFNRDHKPIIAIGPNGQVEHYATADDAAIAALGRDSKEWTIYGCLEPLSFEIGEMEAEIMRRMNQSDTDPSIAGAQKGA